MATANKKLTTKKRAPANNRAVTSAAEEKRVIEANQILGVFKSHVENADTVERLDELKGKADLMGFTQGEIEIAQRWIEKRRGEIADVG